MTDFTREWIAKREQLEQTATEGPWLQDACDPGIVRGEQRYWSIFESEMGHDAAAAPSDAEFIADARTSLPAALAALKAVLKLHRLNREDDGDCQGYTSSGYGYLDRWCVECSDQSGREYGTPWPCPAVRAVDAALRGDQ